MLFTSLPFLILLTITFLVYYLPAFLKLQVPVLIVASLVFYAYNQPVLVLLLLLSVSINVITSYWVAYGQIKNRKKWAVAGVALNLAILVFFKYSGLLYLTFFNDKSSFGELLLNIPLPIGISFFTFQGISLIVDVYTQKYAKDTEVVSLSFAKHAERVLFFKGFFPQLISGPIVKAHDFLPQIGSKKFKDIDWESVVKKLIIGYFFKAVVADNLADFTFWMTYPYFIGSHSLKLIVMLLAFSAQIFADFAGYSLIAIGLAKLFGYRFADNFNFPYISASFKDFWKRWNISLSTFLMEYLYLPLGGNRRGKLRTYMNLMVVMVLGGLWHGAAWSYAVWGAMHGAALIVERLFTRNHPTKTSNFIIITLKRLFIFSYVTLAWLLFKLPEFSYALKYVVSIFYNTSLVIDPAVIYMTIYSCPVFLYHLFYLNRNSAWFRKVKKVEYIVYALLLFFILLNSGPSSPFIYFQF